MLGDLAIVAALLIAARAVRRWIAPCGWFRLPPAVVAGGFAVAGGPEGLGILPFEQDPNGDTFLARRVYELVVLLFAMLMLGWRRRPLSLQAMVRESGDTIFYSLTVGFGQYALALLVGLTCLPVFFPHLPDWFALMLPAGFMGGYGTSTAIGGTLRRIGGRDDALMVGYTFSTIGLVSGLLVGMVLANIGIRRGWNDRDPAPDRSWHGPGKGGATGRMPVESAPVGRMTMESLTWHTALALTAFGSAFVVQHALDRQTSLGLQLPLFAISMLAGGLIQATLNRLGLGDTVDAELMGRMRATVSDFLVAMGIASIKFTIVRQYAAPIAVMSGLGIVYSVGVFWLLGRRMFLRHWFARSLFAFGWSTGVISTSIALLQMIDPDLETGTLEDYGTAYVFIAPCDLVLMTVLPMLVAQGVVWEPALVLSGAAVACLVIGLALNGRRLAMLRFDCPRQG